jgi:hypothetical protein
MVEEEKWIKDDVNNRDDTTITTLSKHKNIVERTMNKSCGGKSVSEAKFIARTGKGLDRKCTIKMWTVRDINSQSTLKAFVLFLKQAPIVLNVLP